MHVAEAFFAGTLRLEIVLNAMGEVIGFCLELGGIAGGVELVNLGAGEVAAEAQAFVDKGLIDLEPALRSIDAVVALHVGSIGGGATGDDAGRKLHGPGVVLFDFVEAAVVVDG